MKDFTDEINKSLDLLFKVEEKQIKKKQLIQKAKTIYLQVLLFRIPYTPKTKREFLRLRHSLYGDDPEICLFVPNRKTGVPYKKTTDELIDFCVDHYTEILEKHKIKGISTIMPVKQLTSEYAPYELRRKLVKRFDLFLCKKSLLFNEKFISSLGKSFKIANKIPLGIPFPNDAADYNPKFKESIERAIFTSPFYINRFSDNYSIPIGCLSNTKKELKENLETVLEQLFKNDTIIPGGFKNVRGLYLWPSQSKSIPLYICTELPVDMKATRVKTKNRKKVRGVEGELSTQPNKKVFVTPNGEVFVTKLKASERKDETESEDDGSFHDESDNENEEEKKEDLKTKIKSTGGEEEETESEDDEEIEEKEARLLEEKRQAEEEESDSEEKPQQNAVTKGNLNKNQKSKRKRSNPSESDDEETITIKKKKSGGVEGKGKVKKAKRKMLMKQEKSKIKEKINQKRKSKQKKV